LLRSARTALIYFFMPNVEPLGAAAAQHRSVN
jgi:hypothetical protein